MGGGQEGNYVQTLPGAAHWARRGEEVAGEDERTNTRRGTGPAPFPLFGYTSPIICLAGWCAHKDHARRCIYPLSNRQELENQRISHTITLNLPY